METILHVLSLISSNALLFTATIFLFMFFLGEPAVVAIAFYAGTSGLFSPFEIAAIAYATAIPGELFWFFIARSPFYHNIARRILLHELEEKFIRFVRAFGARTPFTQLFFSRIVSGLTIFVITVVSRKGISLKRFIKYSLLINAFWTSILVTLGFSAGKGFTFAFILFEDVRYAFSLLFFSIAGIYLMYHLIIGIALKKNGKLPTSTKKHAQEDKNKT